MKCKKLIFIFVLIYLLLALAIPAYCNEKPTCLVLIFYPDEASSEQLEGRYITNKFAQLLDRLDIYDVIDRTELTQRITDEKYWKIVETCKNNECAIEAGRLVNVDYVIHGIVGHIGSLSSLDTTLLNIKTGEVVNVAGTDYEGSKEDFAEKAPEANIKSLLGILSIPEAHEATTAPAAQVKKETVESEIVPEQTTEEEPQIEEVAKEKKFHIGPRLGLVASDDGAEFGGGIEVQFSHISCQILGNDSGFGGGLSYYLHANGNTPFFSVAAAYYEEDHRSGDEDGVILGVLLGYRLNINEKLNARIGLGVGVVDWERDKWTDKNGIDHDKQDDKEIIPIAELTLGYMF